MKRFFSHIHHMFVPSHRNNFKARILHVDYLLVMVLISMMFSFFTTYNKAGVLGIAQDITVERLLQLTNEIRTQNGLPPLRYNDKLSTAAQNKASDMFTHNYWSHFRPGRSPWDFIHESGYSYEFAGENLAHGFMLSNDVTNAWMNSSTHAANILRADYNEIGFAVMNGTLQGEETTLVVQMFGTPLSQNNSLIPVAQAESLPQARVRIPTSAPDTSPTTTADPNSSQPESDSSQYIAGAPVQPKSANYISLQSFTLNSSLGMLGFVIAAILIDFYFIVRMNIIRSSSKVTAHMLFLTFIIVAFFVIKSGMIL